MIDCAFSLHQPQQLVQMSGFAVKGSILAGYSLIMKWLTVSNLLS
jgi:hypothetical protein